MVEDDEKKVKQAEKKQLKEQAINTQNALTLAGNGDKVMFIGQSQKRADLSVPAPAPQPAPQLVFCHLSQVVPTHYSFFSSSTNTPTNQQLTGTAANKEGELPNEPGPEDGERKGEGRGENAEGRG